MAQTMTPSEKTTTAGQIDKAVANYRALLEKYVAGFQAEAVQTVLGQSELAGEMLALFRRRIEAISNMIVRTVRVDRILTPQQALEAIGRRLYVDEVVVNNMPRGEGDEVTMYYFDLDYDPTPVQLQTEYDKRNLVADPIAQAADNAANRSFADERPNGCQWDLREDGTASFTKFYHWIFVKFDCWIGERAVCVRRDGSRWGRIYRFGGVRK